MQSLKAAGPAGDEVTELAYTIEGGGFGVFGGAFGPVAAEAGQYVFLNVPCISALEWHPFTISSAPGDLLTSHHIKSMGESQFTGKLLALAKALGGDAQVRVFLFNLPALIRGSP